MDVKKWNALLTAARMGSFSKAAEELGYTQSGLTYMMNSLEEEIGFPLLVRSWDGVRLTAEGENLLTEIENLVRSDEALRERLAEIGGKLGHRLCIGTYASISVHWLSAVLGRFHREVPNTEIELRIGSHSALAGWLEDGSVNFTLADRLDVPSAEWIPLYDDPLIAVLPKDHPAAGGEKFAWSDFGGLPFLVPSESTVGDNDLKGRVHRRGNLQIETEDDAVMLSMVERGVGISVLAELSARGRTNGVAVLPLAEPLYRSLGITRKVGARSGVASRKLLALLRANLPTPGID